MKPLMIATALAMLATPAYADTKNEIKYCKMYIRCLQKATKFHDENQFKICKKLKEAKNLSCALD